MRDTFRSSVLVAVMLLFVIASGKMVLAQTVSDQAKPVLDRAIQFVGGAANIRAVNDFDTRSEGLLISPQGAMKIRSHSITVYPGIYRYEYKLSLGRKSMSVEAFFDGTNGWRMADGGLKDMNEDEKNGTRQEMFNANLLRLIGSPTVIYEGKSGGNDVLLFGLGDLSARLHVDLTGQVVKLAYRDKTDDIEETFSDYREVGGVKMAYKVSATRNGQKFLDAQITEATANTNPSLEKLAQKPGGQPLSATYLATIAPLKLPALYVSAQTPADQLQLKTDNSLSLQEAGQAYHGTFVINGNLIELNITETNAKTTLTRQGVDLTDSSGQTWTFRK